MSYCRMVLSAVTLALAPAVAFAEGDWKPTKSVQFVVHSSAGAGNDLIARDIVQIIDKHKLSDVRFQVINKPGGGTTETMAYLVSREGDDHTIAMSANAWLTENLLQEEARYNWLDFTSIALLGEDPWVMLVKADSPFTTLKSVVEEAISSPKSLSQSGGVVGSREHMSSLNLMHVTGAQWNFVSYPSRGERAAALLGGHVQLYATDVIEATELIRGGRAKPLAVLSQARVASLPEVPTLEEVYPAAQHLTLVRGVAAPAKIPAEALVYYENLFHQVTETPDWKEIANKFGLVGGFMGSDESTAFINGLRGHIRQHAIDGGIKVVR